MPTCGLLGDPGLRAVGLRGRPRPRRWPRSLPRMLGRRWRGEAASGAPTPPLVFSAEPEDRSLGSRPSCAVWLRDPAAGLGGGGRVSPPGPPAHSRGTLPPNPLHERPEGRGVSATGGGAGYNQSQAGNSSRGALAGLREWGGGGGRRGGWQSARTSPPPPPPSPPPASWKLGRRPTPWLRATLLPLGAGGTRRPGSPLWAGPRGAPRISEPASSFETSTASPLPLGSIFFGEAREAGDAPSDSLGSENPVLLYLPPRQRDWSRAWPPTSVFLPRESQG